MARLHGPATESSLSRSAYDTLWQQIRTCELAPGRVLTERKTAIELGIGLTPVRNALARLARDGLLGPGPGTSYRVAPLTRKSADDFFLTWQLIGPEIAGRGVGKASEGQLGRIRGLVADVAEPAAEQLGHARATQFVAAGHALFDLLAVASANDRLQETYRCLVGEMARMWTLVFVDSGAAGSLRMTQRSWQAALDDRDGDRAAEIARQFIEASRARALRLIREDTVVPLREKQHARRLNDTSGYRGG